MVDVVVIRRYRALRDVRFAPKQLTLITGANGTGKSSLYRALTLLQRAATGGLGLAIAEEGGLGSITWAGTGVAEGQAAKRAGREIQGAAHGAGSSVTFGMHAEGLGFELEVGIPTFVPKSRSAFNFDPGVVQESLWVGDKRDRHTTCMQRKGPGAQCFDLDRKPYLFSDLLMTESVLSALREPHRLPELHLFREHLLSLRFYDGFRVDAQSPLRRPTIGVRSTSLTADGANIAACVQTILEVGDDRGFRDAVREALGTEVEVLVTEGPRFEITTRVEGLLRPLRAHELSDGTLRYLALVTALFAPRSPAVAVFNEPESSLHPSLLEPLGHAIVRAARYSQIWVVTHSEVLARVLRAAEDMPLADVVLERSDDGATRIRDQRLLDLPSWPE